MYCKNIVSQIVFLVYVKNTFISILKKHMEEGLIVLSSPLPCIYECYCNEHTVFSGALSPAAWQVNGS